MVRTWLPSTNSLIGVTSEIQVLLPLLSGYPDLLFGLLALASFAARRHTLTFICLGCSGRIAHKSSILVATHLLAAVFCWMFSGETCL
jgi:hypothetical protein